MIIKLKAFCPSVYLSAYLHFLNSFMSASIKMRPPLHESVFCIQSCLHVHANECSLTVVYKRLRYNMKVQ